MGIGKSTLAALLAREVAKSGRKCFCISVAPGSPAYGLPGAVSLGEWDGGRWTTRASEAICSLDAGRFRLPLIFSLEQLFGPAGTATLILDAPVVVRSVSGAELLTGMVDATGIDLVLAIVRNAE